MKYKNLTIQEKRALILMAAEGDEDILSEVEDHGGIFSYSDKQFYNFFSYKANDEIEEEDLESLEFIRQNPKEYFLNDPDNK